MELRTRDVARFLKVPETTVLRWIREEGLPVHRIGERMRFNRVELQEWAVARGHWVSPELFGASPAEAMSLAAALERGGVSRDVPGDSREQVLEAVTRLPGIPAGVDRGLLARLLIGRETLASTAVGDGIAIPHPRDPLVVGVDEPRVLLGFLARPVDFGAIDGRPVRVLFTLLSPSIRQHLQVLAKLAFVLHDPELRELLGRVAGDAAILERVRIVESSATALEASPPPAPPS